jgi:hypothetical protein
MQAAGEIFLVFVFTCLGENRRTIVCIVHAEGV